MNEYEAYRERLEVFLNKQRLITVDSKQVSHREAFQIGL